MMDNNVKAAFSHFFSAAEHVEISRVGSGHINDTYLVRINQAGHPSYVMQRINHSIFKNVEGLMNNVMLVTRHIQNLYKNSGENYIARKVLTFHPTKDGKYFHKDEDGNYWRCCDFIPDTISYDLVTDLSVAAKGAEIFGKFQNQLSTLDARLLVETIPNFHDLEWRWENFTKAIAADVAHRLTSVSAEIEFAQQRYPELVELTREVKSGKLPLRITHNDTKFNNILFSQDGEALCVVDLDTVMPGTVLHDFGDAIRSSCNTAMEDEADLSKIHFNLPIFEAYVEGYMREAGKFLTNSERAKLALSCRFMTFIMGVRFLTDYLDGDTYYKIHHPEHNIQRCRGQFRLIERMEEVSDKMEMIVKR